MKRELKIAGGFVRMKQFDCFGLDKSNECLWRDGVQIALPPKPFAVLRYLVDNPGRLITHDELLDALWPETYVQPQVLRTYMLELRKVLGDDAGKPRFIQTLPKRGYCFVAPVTDQAADSARDVPRPMATPPANVDPIVDRDDELDRLTKHSDLAAAGQRQIVFVSGEAGIGKTALIEAFCAKARSSANIAAGQCVEGLGAKESYYPVTEALGQLCASADGKRACQVLAKIAPLWLPALGRDSEPSANDGQPAAQRTAADLCGALEELAQDKPLLLVFEDVHWADDCTLELISALARRRAPAKLMIVATCRHHEGAANRALKSLKQDLLMRRLGIEIALAPLGKIAVNQLLSRHLEQDALPSGLDGFVYRHSEGNPLFVIAILEHLIAQHVLVRDGQGAEWRQLETFPEIESEVPAELAQMIEVEIERLAPGEQRILEAASLMSIAFPAWAVAAALDADTAETEEKCDELARRLYFLHRAGSDELPDGTHSAFYVFAHGLYREVLYQRQSSSRRSRRHVRIAERLGTLFRGREADVAREMAMHYEAACEWLRAANALRAAAWRAHQRASHAEETELLEHAMKLAKNLGDVDRASCEQGIRTELHRARQPVA
jgi:predicted ATPase/DNA-binding winged helix-turn-helix (wHTH) protein